MKTNIKAITFLAAVIFASCKSNTSKLSQDTSTGKTYRNVYYSTSMFCVDEADTSCGLWMINDLLTKVKNGKIKAYFSTADTVALTAKQIKAALTPPSDTVDVESNDKPGTFVTKIIVHDEFNSNDPNGVLLFEEGWNYDNSLNIFEKKVKSVSIGTKVFNPDGSLKGNKVFFTIKFN
jgi:hypothetical protein